MEVYRRIFREEGRKQKYKNRETIFLDILHIFRPF